MERIIKDPKSKINWEWEPEVSKCKDIYGKFILDAERFVKETITYTIRYSFDYENECKIKKVFEEFCGCVIWRVLNEANKEERKVLFLEILCSNKTIIRNCKRK
jgi:hypothetical protein